MYVNKNKLFSKVMSPEGIVDIARQCIEVTDTFINWDNYLDRNKQFNSSNLEQLRVCFLQNILLN